MNHRDTETPRRQKSKGARHLSLLSRSLAFVFSVSLCLCGSFLTIAVGQPAAAVTVDRDKKTITIEAKVAPRKLEHLKEVYPLEVIATLPHPRGKKAHETIVTIDVAPSAIHKAIESLGLKAGTPV